MQVNVDENVERFIRSLDRQTIAKILRTIDLLERFGNNLGMPHSKKISNGIFELRVRGQTEVRIFYCFYRNIAYLLHGFVKKSQKILNKELRLVQERFYELTLV